MGVPTTGFWVTTLTVKKESARIQSISLREAGLDPIVMAMLVLLQIKESGRNIQGALQICQPINTGGYGLW
jgi:hypothetical protein